MRIYGELIGHTNDGNHGTTMYMYVPKKNGEKGNLAKNVRQRFKRFLDLY